jgi:hypothetical protein
MPYGLARKPRLLISSNNPIKLKRKIMDNTLSIIPIIKKSPPLGEDFVSGLK